MLKPIYLVLGILSLGLGFVGLFLPLLPTVPFAILAAFFFSRSSPRLEAWLLAHRLLGPPIKAWRENGSISRLGKRSAYAAFAASAVAGILLLQEPWRYLPLLVGIAGSLWIHTRPDR